MSKIVLADKLIDRIISEDIKIHIDYLKVMKDKLDDDWEEVVKAMEIVLDYYKERK